MENVLGKAIDPKSLFGGSKNKNPSKEQKIAKEAKTSKSSSNTSVSSPKAPIGGDNKKEKSTSKQNKGSSSKSILDEELEAAPGVSSPKVVDSSNEDLVRENISVPSSNKRPYSDVVTPVEALQNLAIGRKSSSDASTVPPAGSLSKKLKLEIGSGASAEVLKNDKIPELRVDPIPPKVTPFLPEESKNGSPKTDPIDSLLQVNFTSSETNMPKERNMSKERNIEELFESGQHFLFQAGQDFIELKTFAERETNHRTAISLELEEKKAEFDRVFAEKLALEREKSVKEKGEEIHKQLNEELDKLKSLHEQERQEFTRLEKEAYDRGYEAGYEARNAELRKIFSDNKLL